MSPSQLIRASGWAAALAGAFFILAELLTPTALFTNPDALSRVALTDRFVVQSMPTFLAAVLLLAGLLGVYAFQSREARRLGAVGTFVSPVLANGVS